MPSDFLLHLILRNNNDIKMNPTYNGLQIDAGLTSGQSNYSHLASLLTWKTYRFSMTFAVQSIEEKGNNCYLLLITFTYSSTFQNCGASGDAILMRILYRKVLSMSQCSEVNRSKDRPRVPLTRRCLSLSPVTCFPD